MSSEREQLSLALQLDHEGRWDEAHQIVQVLHSNQAYRIHAYLHREEGDLANTAYWYRQAGVSMPDIDLNQEWQNLVEEILPQNAIENPHV